MSRWSKHLTAKLRTILGFPLSYCILGNLMEREDSEFGRGHNNRAKSLGNMDHTHLAPALDSATNES